MSTAKWTFRSAAVALWVAAGVLDHQAFRWIPPLEAAYYNGISHALLLAAFGFTGGLLFRSWWAVVAAPIGYTLGFEAAIDAVSGVPPWAVDGQHVLWLLVTASAPAIPLMLGAALARIVDGLYARLPRPSRPIERSRGTRGQGAHATGP